MPDDELTLQPDGPKAKRTRAPKPVKDPAPSVRLEALFISEFAKRWGFPPIMTPARDRKLLKDLVEQWDEATVAGLVPFFFTTTDPEIKRCRFYNVPDFYYWSSKLRRLQEGHGSLHERSASNVDEITKAMGRGRKA